MTDGIERRGFLALGAIAGLGAGCSGRPAAPPPPAVTEEDVDRLVAALDRHLAETATRSPEAPRLARADARADAAGRELVRSSLRSLVVASAAMDLPLEAQVHPAMQLRLRAALPDMGAAVLGTRAHLAALTPTARADLGRTFREDPQLARAIVDELDVEAARAGVPHMRRLHTRRLAGFACARLTHGTDMFLGDVVAKTDRMTARDHSLEAAHRRLVARVGLAEVARIRAAADAASARWTLPEGGALVAATEGQRVALLRPEPEEPSTEGMIVGASLLGLSALPGIAGAVLISTAGGGGAVAPGGILVTLGGLLLVAGIITFVVSAT